MSGPYDDMLNLPHPVSAAHRQMTLTERAAQFSPFAALSGYEDAIREAARLTEQRIELDDSLKERINAELQRIAAHQREHPRVSITYFLPDSQKSGGACVTQSGPLKKIDLYERQIRLMDGTSIPLDDIYEIHVH